MSEVREELAEHHASLHQAVRECPVALAVDAHGRPDRLGADVAGLLGYVQHVLVLYHNLDDLPDHMRAQANRDLAATHLRARRLRDRARR
nr:hypothetical protein GCM10020241_65610 [Streptoalloteichus tenebrarius]